MKWQWKNCPMTWRGAYQGKERVPICKKMGLELETTNSCINAGKDFMSIALLHFTEEWMAKQICTNINRTIEITHRKIS
jgi:hypothetical protein